MDANDDGTLDCNECDGCGFHEARADQVWATEMSRLAEERELVFDEEDGGYYVSLYFTVDTEDDDATVAATNNTATMNYKGCA